VKLDLNKRYCKCGKSFGFYKDNLYASINSTAIPIGISNKSLREAIDWRSNEGQGTKIEAFVIPKQCDTIEILK
jgi:hypothetical protein